MKRKLFLFVILQFLFVNILHCEIYLNYKVKGSKDILRWNTNNIHYSVHIAGAGDNNLDYNSTLILIEAAYNV